MAKKKLDYALEKSSPTRRIAAPDLPYRPRDPKSYHPNIGLIACGGITESHLKAYKAAGYKVVALCDLNRDRAENRRREFYPKAEIYLDYRDLLKRDDIEVVDIATHPPERLPIIRDALRARKHVLSQKPFVLNLDDGEKLVDLADRMDVKLAVNQNGRWAPHFSYIRNAIDAGLIGDPFGAHLSVHWDHNWVAGTRFDTIRHVILYDFSIHWFDALSTFMRDQAPRRVYASFTHSPTQRATQAMLAQAAVEYDQAQATLAFDADTRFGMQDRIFVAGTAGTIMSYENNRAGHQVALYTPEGMAAPKLKGSWFPDGFHGTMAELLCAIEEKREPANSARDNLRGLALCFAAIAAAETHKPQVPSKVRKLPA